MENYTFSSGWKLPSESSAMWWNYGLGSNPFSGSNRRDVLNWFMDNTSQNTIDSGDYSSLQRAALNYLNPNSNVGGSTSGSLLDGLSSIWDKADNFAGSLGGWGNLLQGIGSLYSMYKGIGLAEDQLDLARDQFNFGRNYSSAQLNNNIDSYNTALADRARTRAFTETGNQNAYKDWYEKNKLDSFRG